LTPRRTSSPTPRRRRRRRDLSSPSDGTTRQGDTTPPAARCRTKPLVVGKTSVSNRKGTSSHWKKDHGVVACTGTTRSLPCRAPAQRNTGMYSVQDDFSKRIRSVGNHDREQTIFSYEVTYSYTLLQPSIYRLPEHTGVRIRTATGHPRPRRNALLIH
jgi:hypothetical protein